MKTTEVLKIELMKKLRIAQPHSPAESIESIADGLIELGAYAHDGTRLVPAGGNRAIMVRASLMAPELAAQLAKEHVAAAAASSSPESAGYERAAARLASMGISLDDALAGDSEAGREFYGIDLSNMPPRGAA